MTYRSLLAFIDRDPLCAARTQVATRLVKDLGRPADLNPDLIVISAHGHDRWTERVLGGRHAPGCSH